MGKKKKNAKKVERETRRLIESISELGKYKNNDFKFNKKVKKKTVNAAKRNCLHYYSKNGRIIPTMTQAGSAPGFRKCRICGAQFKITPPSEENIDIMNATFLSEVDRVAFSAVACGGNKDDLKVCLAIKAALYKFNKIDRNVSKIMRKRSEFQTKREKSPIDDNFHSYAGYDYNFK